VGVTFHRAVSVAHTDRRSISRRHAGVNKGIAAIASGRLFWHGHRLAVR